MSLIRFERTAAPVASVTFGRSPSYDDYERGDAVLQPRHESAGGVAFLGDSTTETFRYLRFPSLSQTDFDSFVAFYDAIDGAANDFVFTDRDGLQYNARFWGDYTAGSLAAGRATLTVTVRVESEAGRMIPTPGYVSYGGWWQYNAAVIWASFSSVGSYMPEFRKSLDNAISWSDPDTTIYYQQHLADSTWIGLSAAGIERSENNTEDWTTIKTNPPSELIQPYVVSPAVIMGIYIVDPTKYIVSIDGGHTWSSELDLPPVTMVSTQVLSAQGTVVLIDQYNGTIYRNSTPQTDTAWVESYVSPYVLSSVAVAEDATIYVQELDSGNTRYLVSTDGGATFVPTDWLDTAVYGGPALNLVAAADYLYCSTTGFVWKTPPDNSLAIDLTDTVEFIPYMGLFPWNGRVWASGVTIADGPDYHYYIAPVGVL